MSLPRTIAIPHGPTIELLHEDERGVRWRCGEQSGTAVGYETAPAQDVAVYAATFAYVRAQLSKIRSDNEIAAAARIAELEAELEKLTAR